MDKQDIEKMVEDVNEKVDVVTAKVEEGVAEAKDTAEYELMKAKDQIAEVEEKVTSYVKENPKKAAAIAAAAGAALGAVVAALTKKSDK